MDTSDGNVSITLDREAPLARVTIAIIGRDGWTAEHVLDMRGRPRPIGDAAYRYNGRRRIKNVPRSVLREGALTGDVRNDIGTMLERLRDKRRDIRAAQIGLVDDFASSAEISKRDPEGAPSAKDASQTIVIEAPAETYVWGVATGDDELFQSTDGLSRIAWRLEEMQEVELTPLSRAGRPRVITPQSLAKARRKIEESGARPTDARVAEVLGVARGSVTRARLERRASGQMA